MKIYTSVTMDWDGNILSEESFEYDGPLALAGGGGGGDSTQTVEQNADPWEPVQPYLEQGFQYAPWLYENPPMYYPGQTVTGLSPETLYAQQMITNQALAGQPMLDAAAAQYGQMMAQGNYNPAYEYLKQTAEGKWLGEQNPYLADYVRIAQESAANPINAQFSSSGRFGSGLHQSELAGRYGDIATSIYAPAYEAERARMADAAGTLGNLYDAGQRTYLAGIGMAPALEQARYMPSQMLGQVGASRDAYSQALLDADMARWNYLQGLPQQQYTGYMGNLNFAAPYGSSTGTTTTDSGGGGFNPVGAIGGGLAGGSLAGTAAATALGLGSVGMWPLAIGGALLGGLL